MARNARTISLPAALCGSFLFSLFLVIAWGGLHDGASAESAPKDWPSSPIVDSAPPLVSHADTAAPEVSSVEPGLRHEYAAPATPSPWGMTPAVSAPAREAAPATRLATYNLAPDPVAQAAAAPSPTQCNGTDNVGGQAVACDITVTNDLNMSTGTSSSSVTVKECHGAANAALPCTTTTAPSSQLTTGINQCNGSGSGGGGTVTCNVKIINNITGVATPTGATVNQCNDSGTGGGIQPTTLCDPLGNTTNATVTQCNGSGNGGGGTMRVRCTVTPSTQTSALPITVNQCNGSGNGGGAVVICTVSITNNVIAPAQTPPAPTPVTPPPATPTPTPPTTPGPTSPTPTSPTPSSPTPAPGAFSPGPPSATPGTPAPGSSPAPGTFVPGAAPATPLAAAPTAFVGAPIAPALPAPVVPAPVLPAPVLPVPALPTTPVAVPVFTAPLPSAGPGLDLANTAPGGPAQDLTSAFVPGPSLPRTGFETTSLVQLALMALALGGLALALARVRRSA
jgi:hypothetical protein